MVLSNPWTSTGALVLLACVLHAQAPRLLLDLNATGTVIDGSPTLFHEAGGYFYFSAEGGPRVGRELYRTRGRATSTASLVADIRPGVGGSDPTDFAHLGSRMFFSADDGVHGRELWVTDAVTNAVRLVDIVPGSTGSSPRNLIALPNGVLFQAWGPTEGVELFFSDGTPAGTRLVQDIEPGLGNSNPEHFVLFRGKAIFSAFEQASGTEVYISDGTTAGTFRLKDLHPTGDGIPSDPGWREYAGRLYFAGADAVHGIELWETDGTRAGTRLAVDIIPGQGGSQPRELTVVGTRLYCAASATLWSFDGARIQRISLPRSNAGYDPGDLVARGAELWFQATDSWIGTELWRLDARSQVLTDFDIRGGPGSSRPSGLTLAGGEIFFVAENGHGRELYRTDAAAESQVRLVADIAPGAASAGPKAITATPAGPCLFSAWEPTHGRELWISDGTAAGTKLLAEIAPGKKTHSGAGGGLLRSGERMFFSGEDGVRPGGIWVSDGTAAGTRQIPGLPLPGLGIAQSLGDLVFYVGLDEKLVIYNQRTRSVTIPGVLAGAYLYRLDPQLTPYAGKMFFVGNSDRTDHGLWCSDGTTAGTRLVYRTDLAAKPYDMTVFRGALWFVSSLAGTGVELFKSDGTTAGTGLALDLRSGPSGSGPTGLRVVDGKAYFWADGDLNQTTNTGQELWITDGTVTGTQALDLTPGPGDTRMGALVAFGERAVFTTWDSGVHALYLSDGTPAGTRRLMTSTREFQSFTPQGDRLFLTADDGVHGRELWVYDGTLRLVRDLVPGPDSANPDSLLPAGRRRLYFVVPHPSRGSALWVSDGTAAGTRHVADIRPDPGNPPSLQWLLDGRLFYLADDGWHGYEWWSIAVDSYADPRGTWCSASVRTPRLQTTDPVLGSNLQLFTSGAPVPSAGAFFAGEIADPEQRLGWHCVSHVDLQRPVEVVVFRPDALGRRTLALPIPNDPNLLGRTIAGQVVYGPSATPPLGLDLTNAVFFRPGRN